MSLRFTKRYISDPSKTAAVKSVLDAHLAPSTFHQPLAVAEGEAPQQFGIRMSAEGPKSYDDVLKLITHLQSRVAASELNSLKNWKSSLEGAKAEFDDKEITQKEFNDSVNQIYSVLRKNYIDDFTRNSVRGGRKNRKTKRSKRKGRKAHRK